MPIIDRVRHVKPGEPVIASVAGRPTRDLEAYVDELRQRITAGLLGQGLIAREQSVEEAAEVGQPVFWDSINDRFSLAIAATEVSDPGGVVLAASGYVSGLVYAKHNDTLADIALLGVFDLDISAATSDTDPGQYYLSGAENGQLVRQRPPVTVPVCFKYGNHAVLVAPSWRNPADDHTHYSFPLVCVPAGDHAVVTAPDPHVITNPDPDLPGWLPADHVIFDGKAPTGASFGYNFSQHAALERAWPPVPSDAVRVTWDKARDLVGGTEIPLGEDGLLAIDSDGIWWMSDANLDVPWQNWAYTAGETAEEPSSDPRAEEMRLILDFGRLNFATDKGAVTELVSDSPFLEIVDCDNEPASAGDLIIRLLLPLLQQDTQRLGHDVIKHFNDETLQLERGVVTEGLIQGAGVSLASAVTRHLDPEDTDTPTVYQGLVTINAGEGVAGREFSWEVIRSEGLRQRFDGNAIYLALPASHSSHLRAKSNIPAVGVPSDPEVRLRLVLVCNGPGTLPPLEVAYRRIPAGSATPVQLPSGDTDLVDLTLPALTESGKQYFVVESATFEVEPGDTLFASVTRTITGGSDSYSDEIGILRTTTVLM